MIRQTGVEVGILDGERRAREAGGRSSREFLNHCFELTKKRFWAADDAAAERAGREPRER